MWAPGDEPSEEGSERETHQREKFLRQAAEADARGDKVLAASLRGAVADSVSHVPEPVAEAVPLTERQERDAVRERAAAAEAAGNSMLAGILRQSLRETGS